MSSRSHGLDSPQLWGSDEQPANAVPAPAPTTPANRPGRHHGHEADGLVLLLSVEQAGRALGVGRSTIYELIHSGDLEVVHVRRSARIPVDAVHNYVRRLRRN